MIYGKNSEGYIDPTASTAIDAVTKIEKEKKNADDRANELIKVLKYIIRKSGFELTGRINLMDKRTGKFYK